MSTRFTNIAHILGRVVAFTAAGVLLPLAVAHATLTISETGSTLIFPLFQTWVAAYAKVDPNLHMAVGATGSEPESRRLSPITCKSAHPTLTCPTIRRWPTPHILNIPLAISAQTVVANLPELRGATLKLSGPVLALHICRQNLPFGMRRNRGHE